MSNRVAVKALEVNDIFMTSESVTVYRATRVTVGMAHTTVRYKILDGSNFEFEFVKPSLSSVTRLDPFC